jgi:hypothetical protein
LVGSLVAFNHLIEIAEFALKHNLNQFIVRIDVGENTHIRKDLSVRDLPQQQLNHNGCLLTVDLKSLRCVRRFPDGLVQHLQSLPVFSSHGLHPPSVVEILTKFVVGLALRERTLLYQVVRSLQVTISQIVPQQQVEKSTLTDFVTTDNSPIQSLQQMLADVLVTPLLFVQPLEIVVQEGTIVIQTPSVGNRNFSERLFHSSETLIVIGIPPPNLNYQNPYETLQL